jgi:hypothetical protein
VSVWGGFVFLATLSFLLLLSFRAAGLRVTTLLREIRYFLFFLLFVFAVRALTLEQSWIPSVSMQKGVSAMVVLLAAAIHCTDGYPSCCHHTNRPYPGIHDLVSQTCSFCERKDGRYHGGDGGPIHTDDSIPGQRSFRCLSVTGHRETEKTAVSIDQFHHCPVSARFFGRRHVCIGNAGTLLR